MLYASRLAVILALAVSHTCAFPAPLASEEFSFYHENVMGTSLELRVQRSTRPAGSPGRGTRALSEIDRLECDLQRLRSGERVLPMAGRAPGSRAGLARTLRSLAGVGEWQRADRRGVRSSGRGAVAAVDASGVRQERLPTARAKGSCKDPSWPIGPGGSTRPAATAERLSDCPLSLNGIAKGFIVERACDAAMAEVPGVTGVMLNVGGDLRTRGADRAARSASPPRGPIPNRPSRSAPSRSRTVRSPPAGSPAAGSGSAADGTRTSSIRGRGGRSSASSARPWSPSESVDADAFAKACNVLEPEESLRLVRSFPGRRVPDRREGRADDAERRLAPHTRRPRPEWLASADEPKASRLGGEDPDGDGDRSKTRKRSEESRRQRPRGTRISSWSSTSRSTAPRPKAGRYRRPYVVVWVEDKEGNLVRTLSLWVSMGGAGPFQWMPDLKHWYIADTERKLRDKKEHVLHDRPADPAARQVQGHLGRQGQPQEAAAGRRVHDLDRGRPRARDLPGHPQGGVTLADKPFTEELKGNVEIRSASIEYRRKAAPKIAPSRPTRARPTRCGAR